MAAPNIPLTWRNVAAPDGSGALNAFNRAGENLGGAFEGLGGAVKQGASDYADIETQDFIADLNAAPDDDTRQQMVQEASQAFLKMDQVNAATKDARAQDFLTAAEGRAVTSAAEDTALHADTLVGTKFTRDVQGEELNIRKDENARAITKSEQDTKTFQNNQKVYENEATLRKQQLTSKMAALSKEEAAVELSNSFTEDYAKVANLEGNLENPSMFAHAYNTFRATYANNPKLTDKHKGLLKTLRGKAIESITQDVGTTEFYQKVQGNQAAQTAYSQAMIKAAGMTSLTARETAQKAAKQALKANSSAMGVEDLTKLAENVLSFGRLKIDNMTEDEATSIMTRMLKSSGLDTTVKNINRAVKIATDTANETDKLIIAREATSAAEKSIQEANQKDLTTAVEVAIEAKRSGVAPVADDVMKYFSGDNEAITEDERLQKSTVSAGITAMIEKLQDIPKYQDVNKGELVLQLGAFLKDSATINTTGTTTELAVRDKSTWGDMIGLNENEIADIGANSLDRMLSQWQKTNGLDTIRDRNVKIDAQIAGVKERLAEATRQRDSIPTDSGGYKGLDDAVKNIQKQLDKLETSK